MFRNILCSVPFVLCSLLATDPGAPAGGGANPTAEPPNPAPPVAAEPEGNTLEEKLVSAKTIIGDYFRSMTARISELTKARSDYTALEGRYTALETTAKAEKEEHVATKEKLTSTSSQLATVTSERDRANSNVNRLEGLCQLRGIDPNQVVPPAPAAQSADDERKAIADRLDKETDPMRRGEIANELRAFDKKRKADKKK